MCAAPCGPDSGVLVALNLPRGGGPGSPRLRSSQLGSEEGSCHQPALLGPARGNPGAQSGVFSVPSSRPRPSCCFLGWILQSSGCLLPDCFPMLRGEDRGAPWGLAVGRAGRVWSRGHSGPCGDPHDPAVLCVNWFSSGLCTGQF